VILKSKIHPIRVAHSCDYSGTFLFQETSLSSTVLEIREPILLKNETKTKTKNKTKSGKGWKDGRLFHSFALLS